MSVLRTSGPRSSVRTYDGSFAGGRLLDAALREVSLELGKRWQLCERILRTVKVGDVNECHTIGESENGIPEPARVDLA